MKSVTDIKQELESNGYNWLPNYKNIAERVWLKMETYFDEDEKVLSALWASFKRYEEEMIGIVFITSKRTFTIEVQDDYNSSQIRYLPFDSYSLQKILVQYSKTDSKLNYVSLQNDSFGNGITFATPSKKVLKHFIDTLRGVTGGDIEILPDSDEPLLAENEKEQLIDKDLEKAKENKPHKFEEKHEEELPKVKESNMWKKSSFVNEQKEVPIKIVPAKLPKQKKKVSGYATKWKSKTWLLWFLIPLLLIIVLVLYVFINRTYV
ncbi:hypothetical protein [Spiroplasma turonicum]|uniref:Uncharacterized protein n=1 Tax=Spiroplasma turonicum TaxID=216946 RepID=A0A0K1P5J2_9MOLU|nr:hypothetical protein [Spiroplasma turonicum]AKU79558.1 hypothetical protein STURON_00312 [Spiroplasma turonicum]ALX70581.1 hypothetical protein STURO_v1c03130 [Spiroplasma turonicum]